MKFVLKSVVAAGLVAIASPVYALELTNSEATDQQVVIVEDGKETAVVIAAGDTLKGVCENACVIKLADGQEYSMEGNEVALLEDGYIYVDDPSDQQYAADDSYTDDQPQEGSDEEAASEEEAPSDEEVAEQAEETEETPKE